MDINEVRVIKMVQIYGSEVTKFRENCATRQIHVAFLDFIIRVILTKSMLRVKDDLLPS